MPALPCTLLFKRGDALTRRAHTLELAHPHTHVTGVTGRAGAKHGAQRATGQPRGLVC